MLTPAGVLGWLTGQQHRPVNGDDLDITVLFVHEYVQRHPLHRVCFPVVSACGKTVTFPVNHMEKAEELAHILRMAYCN